MVGFVLGVIAGGLAALYYRDEINRYFQRQLPSVRERLADQLHRVEERTSDAFGRARTSVSATLRSGEQWLRGGDQPQRNGRTGADDAP